MFEKKKLKNPILVVRKPEEINKEYSEIIGKLGSFEVELAHIKNAQEKQQERIDKIASLKDDLMERVAELGVEMDEAQKEIQRNKEVVPKDDIPIQISEPTQVQAVQ